MLACGRGALIALATSVPSFPGLLPAARGTAMVVCSGAHVVGVAGLGRAPSPSGLRSSFHLAGEHEALLAEPSQVACLDVFAINPVFENRWAAGGGHVACDPSQQDVSACGDAGNLLAHKCARLGCYCLLPARITPQHLPGSLASCPWAAYPLPTGLWQQAHHAVRLLRCRGPQV